MPEMMFPEPGKPEEKKREKEKNIAPHLEFDAEFHPDQRLRQIAKSIRDFVNDPENYMDKGGAGSVYTLGEDAGVCVKIIKNRHGRASSEQYDLGNSIRDEAMFLRKLSDFSVKGVRSPEYISALTGGQYGALIMEKLDAINLQHIINGEAEPPAGFNPVAFFDDVDTYITALHDEKGVCHMDLEPRNLMVDRSTGKPYIIDFGRSVSTQGLSPQERRKREDDDLDKLMAGEKALLEVLDKSKN